MKNHTEPANDQSQVITMRLSPEMTKAIRHLARRHCIGPIRRQFTLEQLTQGFAVIIMQLSLAHPKEIGMWWGAFIRYRDAEGLNEGSPELTAKFLNSMIAAHPSYASARR